MSWPLGELAVGADLDHVEVVEQLQSRSLAAAIDQHGLFRSASGHPLTCVAAIVGVGGAPDVVEPLSARHGPHRVRSRSTITSRMRSARWRGDKNF